MKKVLSLIIFICFERVNAQSIQWAYNFGSTGETCAGKSITHDNSGNCIITGFFGGLIDFNPGTNIDTLLSNTTRDFFVVKLDANGNYLWAFNIYTNQLNPVVNTDINGNIFLTGSFSGTVDFNPSNATDTLSGGGIFVAKYDQGGNFIWAHNISPTIYNVIYTTSSITDATGNIIVTGFFQGTIDFNPGINTNSLTSLSNYHDFFIAKYDANGNYLWAFNVGSANNPVTTLAVCCDLSRNIFVTGGFRGTADFNPGLTADSIMASNIYLPYSDIFLAKYDSNGNYKWAFNVGTSGSYDIGNSLTTDINGNVFVTGHFTDSADFNPDITSNILYTDSSQNLFVAKYNPMGNYVWAFNAGSQKNYSSDANSISIDNNGEIFIAGDFTGTADFNPSSTSDSLHSYGNSDVFIAKYDTNANYTWAFNTGAGSAKSITSDSYGNLWVTGFLNGINNDYDPNAGTYYLNGIGCQDIFIAKYNSTPTAIKENDFTNEKEINIYPNPNNGIFEIETNTNEKTVLQIFDLMGKEVRFESLDLRNSKVNIDASNLPEGIYNLRLSTGEEIINKKLVLVK